jgi:diadenosine tetraphosphate (Ap4A) HIT family hydrolase
MDLTDEDLPFLSDVISAVQELVKTHHLEELGYRLIVNGGRNQEFDILHYHLISEKELIKTD